ncbi:hypothetical protein GOV14_02220 [Candidatus Pacearchaeota archaeon]|nr:hypothetical protein [Candidatus Pacearchaeota archaeon]
MEKEQVKKNNSKLLFIGIITLILLIFISYYGFGKSEAFKKSIEATFKKGSGPEKGIGSLEFKTTDDYLECDPDLDYVGDHPDCKDDNDCTIDKCNRGLCENDPIEDGTSCTKEDGETGVCKDEECVDDDEKDQEDDEEEEEGSKVCCKCFINLDGLEIGDKVYNAGKKDCEEWLDSMDDCDLKEGPTHLESIDKICPDESENTEGIYCSDEYKIQRFRINGHSEPANFEKVYKFCTQDPCDDREITEIDITGCQTCNDYDHCKFLADTYDGPGIGIITGNILQAYIGKPETCTTVEFKMEKPCLAEVTLKSCSYYDDVVPYCYPDNNPIKCTNEEGEIEDRYCCGSKSTVGVIPIVGFPIGGGRILKPGQKCCADYDKSGVTDGEGYYPDEQTCCIDEDGNGKVYDEKGGTCCEGELLLEEEEECCKDKEGKETKYDPSEKICCKDKDGNGIIGEEGQTECCGDENGFNSEPYNPETQECCLDGQGTGTVTEEGEICCGEEGSSNMEPYDPNIQICCINKEGAGDTGNKETEVCCGDESTERSRPYDPTRDVCCNIDRRYYESDSCCGEVPMQKAYDSKIQQCCDDDNDGKENDVRDKNLKCGSDDPPSSGPPEDLPSFKPGYSIRFFKRIINWFKDLF